MKEYFRRAKIFLGQPKQSQNRIRWLRLPVDKPYVNLLLILLTIGSTYAFGGVAYSAAVISILLAHEMGHYLMCRRHRVSATLPFFIPLPGIGPFGTLGAVIQMKSPIPNRKALFDIGIAGPLAGLVLTIPVIFFGVRGSEIVESSKFTESALMLGESLLFKAISKFAVGPLPAGHDINLSPLAYAGWVGLFVTALNLLPIGQLDGGHVAYAIFGSKARRVFNASLAGFAVCTIFFPGWILMFTLLLFFGYKHPPPIDDYTQLDAKRRLIGLLVFLIFIVSFTPIPFKF